MTRDHFLSEELINERMLEEIRENIESDFQLAVNRPRYKSVAARVYIALADIWRLTQSESAELLHISEDTFDAWQRGCAESLTAENMEKISCLMGIYKYLCILFSGHMDRVGTWLQRENYGNRYGGRTPYELLVKHGSNEFRSIRRDLASLTV